MSLHEQLDAAWQSLRHFEGESRKWIERLHAQVDFAVRLAEANPSYQTEWEGLILRAVQTCAQAVTSSKSVVEAVKEAEDVLRPLAPIAKPIYHPLCWARTY
jgi:hypothetical protein